ncbi:hypothetical protein [Actinophytocola sp.]|uniref:DUF7711 family protein n=1 Tax=Actinophytocola sp. TaxID=1872138 RepID=UPI00389A4757
MRYGRGVQRLRMLADACQELGRLEKPLLHEAYVFGELLDGADPVEGVDIALVLDLPPEEVPWGSQPSVVGWLVRTLRLDKGGFAFWWRSRHVPVWNHHIRGPVRFWSLDGVDEDVLDALAEQRFGDLPRVWASEAETKARAASELEMALARLRAIHRDYWERDWRREHRGDYRFPENALWEAVDGYLELLDAAR